MPRSACEDGRYVSEEGEGEGGERPSSRRHLLLASYVQPFTPCQLRFAVLLFLDGWLMPLATLGMVAAMGERLHRMGCLLSSSTSATLQHLVRTEAGTAAAHEDDDNFLADEQDSILPPSTTPVHLQSTTTTTACRLRGSSSSGRQQQLLLQPPPSRDDYAQPNLVPSSSSSSSPFGPASADEELNMFRRAQQLQLQQQQAAAAATMAHELGSEHPLLPSSQLGERGLGEMI